MADACVEVANMLVNGEGVQKIYGTRVKTATRIGISSSSVGNSLGGTTYTGLSDSDSLKNRAMGNHISEFGNFAPSQWGLPFG